MGSWIHDGLLDSRWVPGFTMGFWIHEEVLRFRFTMFSGIHDALWDSRWVGAIVGRCDKGVEMLAF